RPQPLGLEAEDEIAADPLLEAVARLDRRGERRVPARRGTSRGSRTRDEQPDDAENHRRDLHAAAYAGRDGTARKRATSAPVVEPRRAAWFPDPYPMPIDVTMPKLSDTMEEGKILKWLKHPGDRIAIGDVLAEVETDKANMELEAFDEGVLSEVRIDEGGS